MLKTLKALLFISIIVIIFSILVNLNDYANYKQFISFWEFESMNFKLGTWYIFTLVIGIILFVISIIAFLNVKNKTKQGKANGKKN